jgi:hypothetical protein
MAGEVAEIEIDAVDERASSWEVEPRGEAAAFGSIRGMVGIRSTTGRGSAPKSEHRGTTPRERIPVPHPFVRTCRD